MSLIKHTAQLKPFLKWAGGKRQLLPQIRSVLATCPALNSTQLNSTQLNSTQLNSTYIEPFVGAGAVFFDLAPKQAFISDKNTLLIETYTCIRDHIDELIAHLRIHETRHNEAYYYAIRAHDRDARYHERTSVERAARLIYLNRTCYNGLYRVNRQGYFNVPYGKYTNPQVCDEPLLRSISQFLCTPNITIQACDYQHTLMHAQAGDLVYFDPPYHSPEANSFTSYQADGFSEQNQEELAHTYAQLTHRGVYCVLSNADTPFVRALYKAYACVTIQAKRPINSRGTARGPVNEVLVWNWS